MSFKCEVTGYFKQFSKEHFIYCSPRTLARRISDKDVAPVIEFNKTFVLAVNRFVGSCLFQAHAEVSSVKIAISPLQSLSSNDLDFARACINRLKPPSFKNNINSKVFFN